MLITKIVIMKWHPRSKVWYVNKGYTYTKMGKYFDVKVGDLQRGSCILVDVKCDCGECKNPYLKPTWSDYFKCVKKDGKYYCSKCAKKLYIAESARKTRLKNGKSFEQWGLEELSKKDVDEILLRWVCELNVDKDGNKLTPKDVSFSSRGLNGKGYWFKCLDHPEHMPEQKNIKSFTHGHSGSICCVQCFYINDLSTSNKIFY